MFIIITSGFGIQILNKLRNSTPMTNSSLQDQWADNIDLKSAQVIIFNFKMKK